MSEELSSFQIETRILNKAIDVFAEEIWRNERRRIWQVPSIFSEFGVAHETRGNKNLELKENNC